MKNIICKSILITGALFLQGQVRAQLVEVTAVPVTSAGTISKVSAQSILINTPSGEQPVEYLSSETTHYVDANGNPVDIAVMKSGLPVTVSYTKTGDTLVATKVMVGKSVMVNPAPAVESSRVVSTTTAGIIREFGESRFVIKSDTSPDPVSYTYSKTTTYLDEDGKPVDLTVVKSGVPVTVYYTKEGDTMVASRVIVRRGAPAPAQVIEQKKTTTTETTTDR